MSKINGFHRPDWDYEGYGVYDFSQELRGYGQLPPGVTVEDIVKNMDAYIVLVDGIQVAKIEVQQPVKGVLDKMDFNPDGPTDTPTVQGEASFSLFSAGSNFASDYSDAGYAIMADRNTVQSGNPRMLLTQIARVVADNAFEGGAYVVLSAPSALLRAASELRAGGGGAPAVPSAAPPPPAAAASTTGPSWVLPAVIAVGGLALIAVASATGKK
jgi:hypothetical protein